MMKQLIIISFMKKFMYFVAVLMLTTIVFSCKKDDKE